MSKREEGRSAGGGLGLSAAANDVIAGGAGGVAQCLIGHPFDTVRVLMQAAGAAAAASSAASSSSGSTVPKTAPAPSLSATGVVRGVLARDGVRGLYAGMSAPLLGITGINMILFTVNNNTRRFLEERRRRGAAAGGDTGGGDTDDGDGVADSASAAPMWEVFASGANAGLVNSVLVSPTELVKCRVQVRGEGEAKRRSSVVAREILSREGVRGLYRGFAPTVLRESIGNGMFFTGYAAFRSVLGRALDRDPSALPVYLLPACGAAGGVSHWCMSLPFDAVKTRMQLQSAADPGAFSGMTACARHIARTEGIQGFYRGLTPTLVRAVPTAAGILTTYEITMRFLTGAL